MTTIRDPKIPTVEGEARGQEIKKLEPEVIDGFRPKNSNNVCGPQDDLGTVARMPRDTGLTQVGSSLIGSTRPTTAEKNAYWQYHHAADWPVAATTRYQAYLTEIGMLSGGSWGTSPAPENGAPVCAPSNVRNSGTASRRILYVAIVDCTGAGVRGNSTTNVRTDKYAEFFLTEPSSGGTVYTEFVRMLTLANDVDSKLHKIVQLYR